MKIVITANKDAYPAGHPNEYRSDPQSSDDVACYVEAKYGLFSTFAKRNVASIINIALNGASDDEIETFVTNKLKEEIIEDNWPIEGTPTKAAKTRRGAMGKGTRKGMSFRDTDTMLNSLGTTVERNRDVA